MDLATVATYEVVVHVDPCDLKYLNQLDLPPPPRSYENSVGACSPTSYCFFRLCKTGSCCYHLGVEDDGTHSLRKFDDLKKSFEVLCNLAEEFGAKVRGKC